jgi:hypothetical protein
LTLRRLGRHKEAQALLTPIAADLDVIENHAYHALLRAFASGDVAALGERGDGTDRATIGNGVAAWRLVQNDVAGACAGWAQIVAATPWPAFGHIAAEVELQRTCPRAARQ